MPEYKPRNRRSNVYHLFYREKLTKLEKIEEDSPIKGGAGGDSMGNLNTNRISKGDRRNL